MKRLFGTVAGITAASLFLTCAPVSAYAREIVPADVPALQTASQAESADDDSEENNSEEYISAAAQTDDYIQVYTDPDFESQAAGKLYDNNLVTIEDREGIWYRISSGNVEGYIVSDGTLDEDAEAVQAASENASYGETPEEEAARIAEEEAAAEEAAEQKIADQRQAVVDYALQFVGNPYVYGGSSLTNGTDCSGFIMSVYAHFGVELPHSSRSDRSAGTAVSEDDMQPGDIVCYSGHVALYIGDGKIVHASSKKTGIIISDVRYRSIVCVRRIYS